MPDCTSSVTAVLTSMSRSTAVESSTSDLTVPSLPSRPFFRLSSRPSDSVRLKLEIHHFSATSLMTMHDSERDRPTPHSPAIRRSRNRPRPPVVRV